MDESTRKEILQRVDRRKSITPLVLLSLGVLLMVSPLGIVQGLMGEATWQGLTRFFLGVLFVYLGGLVMERQHQTDLMRKLLESNEALMHQLLGPDYKKKRGVELLISMLSTTDHDEARERIREQLQRISGEDFPAEFDPWDRWWKANKDQLRFAPEKGGGS